VIVATVAAATASAGLIFFNDVADRIPPIPGFNPPPPKEGDPYTILLLGSDQRSEAAPEDQRSDTTMLLRLDPDQGVISLLSLPRDLSVEIPGYGSDKLNAAYSLGGPKLTTKTVKQLTGLQINDVVDVDFQGFADAVNAVDCVYIDVDQDYYIPEGTGVSAIDVNAGYQRLCGLKALQYVRYRHTDNDIVRAARQQSFLREARQRIDVGQILLGGGGGDLLEAFVDNTRSTIDGGSTVRDIATSLFDLRSASVNQIEVSGDLGPIDIHATADEISRAVAKFLNGGTTGEQSGSGGDEPGSGGSSGSGDTGGGSNGDGGGDGSGDGSDEVAELPAADPKVEKYARTADRRLGFPVYYPTKLPADTTLDSGSRTYEFKDEEDDVKNAYKLVFQRPNPSIVTEYFGMEGTTWGDPPILDNPSDTLTIGDREYLLFYAGDRLRLVGWKQDGNSYWISNSLLNTLSENEMMAIAESVAPAPPKPTG
jgi:LCP family protein required for cell wall assembly